MKLRKYLFVNNEYKQAEALKSKRCLLEDMIYNKPIENQTWEMWSAILLIL